jgi:hypothetical protein
MAGMRLFRRPAARAERALALELPNGPVQCRLRLSSQRRTLALRVSAAGEVVLNAPLRLPQGEIEQFLHKHVDWIVARLDAVRADVFDWRDGALLPYLGGALQLRLTPHAGATPRRVAAALICAGDPAQAAAQVLRWYRREARAHLLQRLAHHAARAGVALPPLRLSDARTRWGSLSPKGVVSLNWRLIKASLEELDYVICHELAHFRQRNHSAAFWREVAILFPDYARVRASLRLNGRGYFAF